MIKNKLAIIGGSGLYDIEEFKERSLDLNTAGKPSDKILKPYKNKDILSTKTLQRSFYKSLKDQF